MRWCAANANWIARSNISAKNRGLCFSHWSIRNCAKTCWRIVRQIGVPTYDVLEAPIAVMRQFLGAAESHRPGGQHEVDQRYLQRIEALNFTIRMTTARHSKRSTMRKWCWPAPAAPPRRRPAFISPFAACARPMCRIVPGMPLPPQLLRAKRPLIVGLWASPDRLVQVRRNRLNTLGEVRDTSYVDLENVRAEVTATRKLFEQQDWPAIDVSRRSVEETAAAVLNLLAERQDIEP